MPYISHISKQTTVLGPGKRFVIWFQGCEKRCEGCINPAGQEIGKGIFIEVDELIEIIKNQKDIVGITISGGEPFLQVNELRKVINKIKSETNLDIMLYSGYLFQELVPKYGVDFFELIDIFIDGEYVEELNNDSIYRGSDNQKIYFFTNKYKKFKDQIISCKNRNIEFELNQCNELFLIGIPPKGFYQKLLDKITERNE